MRARLSFTLWLYTHVIYIYSDPLNGFLNCKKLNKWNKIIVLYVVKIGSPSVEYIDLFGFITFD